MFECIKQLKEHGQYDEPKFDEEDICSFMASYSELIIDIANRYFEIEKMQGDDN